MNGEHEEAVAIELSLKPFTDHRREAVQSATASNGHAAVAAHTQRLPRRSANRKEGGR